MIRFRPHACDLRPTGKRTPFAGGVTTMTRTPRNERLRVVQADAAYAADLKFSRNYARVPGSDAQQRYRRTLRRCKQTAYRRHGRSTRRGPSPGGFVGER
jgi:hypothetical protein